VILACHEQHHHQPQFVAVTIFPHDTECRFIIWYRAPELLLPLAATTATSNTARNTATITSNNSKRNNNTTTTKVVVVGREI